MKAVIIGNDEKTSKALESEIYLQWSDAVLCMCNTATEGVDIVRRELFDVVLFHPDYITDKSFVEVIREIRQFSNVPIVVFRKECIEFEVITAIDAGADQYIRLPCDPTEIMARIWALLRVTEVRPLNNSEAQIRNGELLIKPATLEVFLGGTRLVFTTKEFQLLYALAKNQGSVVPSRILEEVMGAEERSNLVKKYVQRVREKLHDNAKEPEWIATVHGLGYRLLKRLE